MQNYDSTECADVLWAFPALGIYTLEGRKGLAQVSDSAALDSSIPQWLISTSPSWIRELISTSRKLEGVISFKKCLLEGHGQSH